MNILVLVKEVPVVSDIRIDRESFTIDRSGAGNMTNPADRHAIQAAVELAAMTGGRVTALSMGPEHCEAVLREAVSLGAKEAVRITDNAFAAADTLVTSRIIKAAIDRLGGFDCIFCGAASVDGATGQLAAKLGSMLGVAALTNAAGIEMSEKGLSILRKAGDGFERLEADFPLICSVTEDANTVGSVSIKGKMEAKKAVISLMTNEELGLSGDELASPSKVAALFTPAAVKKGTFIRGESTEAAAEELVKLLLENKYI